jgi:tungstate transport system ATP-binding protein
MARLELTGAAYRLNGENLLGPVDLVSERGDITTVLGQNGAGKSLFLALCHGTIPLSAGQITWDGAPARTTRRTRGFMFQNSPVLRRSVADNVAFPLLTHKLAATTRRDMVDRTLARVRLSEKARVPAAALSGGEGQRMALARALVTDPKVIFLDEPSASLDPASTKELELILAEITKRGVKLFIATHDLAQARRLADEVIFLHCGKVVEHGPAQIFFDGPQTLAARNYLEGIL